MQKCEINTICYKTCFSILLYEEIVLLLHSQRKEQLSQTKTLIEKQYEKSIFRSYLRPRNAHSL